MTTNNELSPCPFCGCAVALSAVARDWWRVSGDHDDDCILHDQRPDAPQTDDQKRLLTAAWNRRQPAMAADEWLLIDTAPKDGTSVLLRSPAGRVADGFFSPSYKVWSWPYVMVNPTHWMPLSSVLGARRRITGG